MKVLITGGAGFIGSHTCFELLSKGHEVLVVDNLSNSRIKVIETVRYLSKRNVDFAKIDIRDTDKLYNVLKKFEPDTVIHFAGVKAVSESILDPIKYYDINVNGSISLLEAMSLAGCKNIVFSSSATVYGDPKYLPYDELHPTSPVNPYGRTKLMAEDILRDWVKSHTLQTATVLRYFNPIGAHASGQLGENPLGIPDNLMPFITQVAIGEREYLRVFGNDYDTRDGTGMRDYIHVVDLAKAHVAAINRSAKLEKFNIINIGSGKATTVMELVNSFEDISGRNVPIKFVERRQGDLAASWADSSLANELLGWSARYTIDTMCADAWRWQVSNLNLSS